MSALDELIRVVERLAVEGAPIAGYDLKRRNLELTSLAMSWGVLRRVGTAPDLVCPACDTGHRVPVFYRDGAFVCRCPWGLTVALTDDDVALYEASVPTFIELMQLALGVPRRTPSASAGEALHRIGLVAPDGETPEWSALFGLGLGDGERLSSALYAIGNVAPRGPGLVISASPVPPNLPLPRRYQLVRPSDVFDVTSDRLIAAQDRIARCFQRRRAQQAQRRARSRLSDVRAAVDRLRHQPDWPDSRSGRAKYLKAHWPGSCGSVPARSVLMNHLKSLDG